MVKAFPDETLMERSQDNSEPIRGGSIAFNRILGRFVTNANNDHVPEFTAVIMSAFTVFDNVWTMEGDVDIHILEQAFVKDINLFLEYYDIYLSFVKTPMMNNKKCPVVIYFPDYRHVEKELLREPTGKKLALFKKYKMFLNRYSGRDELVKTLDHVRCFWIRAGDVTYPHKEVARKFKDIVASKDSLYSTGDKIALVTHVVLDYHICSRLRNIYLLERYTGLFKKSDQFKLKLDKDGRIPFTSICHVVFGDSYLIKPMVTPKIRKILFTQAEQERWVNRSENDLVGRISKTTNIPTRELRKYDFI